jgi:hypothetical protein
METERYISEELETAIRQAVREFGQPGTVAKQLNRWLEDLAAGEDVFGREEFQQRLELIYDELVVKEEGLED